MTRIHLITPIVTPGIRSLGDIAHLASDRLSFSHTILDEGPASIQSHHDEALAVPDTVRKALAAEADGADAVVIDCMGDPGLAACRERLSIPVFGPGQTSMHMAAMLGHRFSIVTVLESVRPMLEDLALVYGLSHKLASIRVVGIPVLEIETRFDEVQRLLAEESLAAVIKDRANAIVLGCTGFLGCADAIQRHLAQAGHRIPVIDPIPTTVLVAEAAIRAGNL